MRHQLKKNTIFALNLKTKKKINVKIYAER